MSSKFDLDLAYGKVYEKKLYDILQNKKVEVKTERDIWKVSGNIAIEYEYKGKPSGIAITEASWWAHILSDGDDIECILMMPTEKLKNVARDHFKNSIMGGDDNQSKMILVPISEIMNGDKK
jgi:hypothetical protein|tara:strand:+ start:149 stop:514 length:366 start_codon:yes stop_codon:yes gene_type:complete